MKSLVIYDSYFGNTEKIANAIGKGLGGSPMLRIDDMKEDDLNGLDVLVLGSPTRGFRPTEKITGFLKGLENGSLRGIKVAAFDTRIDPKEVGSRFLSFMVNMFGYAADPIAKGLKKKGGEVVVDPEGFVVKDTEGPLREGEEQRAVEWGKEISRK